MAQTLAAEQVWAEAAVDEAEVRAGADPESMFWNNCRHFAVYIGYTYAHLPWLKLRPLGVNAIPATAAILAARMAFSNLLIRSPLK